MGSSAGAASDEYERLVEWLVGQLALRAGVRTERIERDVVVKGRATGNQIDVLWDFTDAADRPCRVIFEARSYRNRIKQGGLHAFRSVVDDVQDQDRPVTGVMVTTTGYQRGATNVATTYGVIVLELRSPTTADLDGRVTKVEITFDPQMPIIRDVRLEAAEVHDVAAAGGWRDLTTMAVARAGCDPEPLKSLLLHEELGALGSPRPVHAVRREFEPHAHLLVAGRPVALIAAATAQVGDVPAPTVTVTVDGSQSVAWMLRDALSGARTWIAGDGRTWSTSA